jgi:hypothetical protein
MTKTKHNVSIPTIHMNGTSAESRLSLTRKRRLPEGWSESAPGRLMTNPDPIVGGVIDCEDVSGEWFVIFSRNDLPVLDGFASRADAFRAHQEATRNAAD